jgi:hypothetical protein
MPSNAGVVLLLSGRDQPPFWARHRRLPGTTLMMHGAPALRERDRHIHLSNAAFIPRSDLLDTGDGAGNHSIKPAPTTRDRCDQRGARLGANRSTVVWGMCVLYPAGFTAPG